MEKRRNTTQIHVRGGDEKTNEQLEIMAKECRMNRSEVMLEAWRVYRQGVYRSKKALQLLIPDIDKAKFELLGETVGAKEYKTYWDFVRENR